VYKEKNDLENMISRILLINSPRISSDVLNADTSSTYYEVYPPLGILYISSMIKRELQNVEVQVFDLHFEGIKYFHNRKKVDWIKLCKKRIEEFQPDLIGISVIFGASFSYAKSVGIAIKELFPKVVTVGGGVHITGIANDEDVSVFCDFVSLFESEYHFLGLIKYLNNQQNYLKGIVVNNESLIRNKGDVLPDIERPERLDDIPAPDFGAVDLGNYYKYGILSAEQTTSRDIPKATMLTSRGCVGNCKFCSVRSFNGIMVRAHSPERVLNEIDTLYNEFGIGHIDFVDDDFTHNRKRINAILDGLIERHYLLTWSLANGVRVGTLTEEILDKMVKSGCTYFSIGIESGNQNILKEMRKPLTIELLRRKIPLLHKYNEIYYRANFMVGFPGETLEQMENTFSLAEEIALDWSVFSICTPLPDTDLYNEILKNSSDFNSGMTDYSFASSKGMLVDKEKEDYIFDLVYTNNLKINFKNNINLKGRNIERAVKDFERVVKIAKDHAFAWNCLAKGYKALCMSEKEEGAVKETNKIIEKNPYWRKKFEEIDFAIEN
jgi:radical SAM superfamily enzyme YgiQ (UPF0313 family)